VKLEATLQITRFVFVDNVFLGELIQHSGNFGQKSLGRTFVRGVAQSFDRIAGGFVIVPVANPVHLGLTDSFL
jgi:hypothetical protein